MGMSPKRKRRVILTVVVFCILLVLCSGFLKERPAPGPEQADVTDAADKADLARLEDGRYTPDQFGFSGGTGKVTISCPEVSVQDGRAYASLVFDSGSYSYVKVEGRTYEGVNTEDTSTFEIPVRLNQNNTVIGCTTKMSSAHEISYTVFVYIEEKDSKGSEAKASAGDNGLSPSELSKTAPKIAGLTFIEETEAEYAVNYKIFHYEGGITCIETDPQTEEDTKILRYLVAPADAGIPAGLEHEMTVIRRPAQREGEAAFHAYAASLPVLAWMEDSGQWKHLALTGIEEAEGQAKERDAVFGGTYDDVDYKALVKARCDLAVMPAEILPAEGSASRRGKYTETLEYCEELGIPMFVDLASREKTKEGQDEWRKVYEIIFGCGEVS